MTGSVIQRSLTPQVVSMVSCSPPICTTGTPGTRDPDTNTYSFSGGLDSTPHIINPIGLPSFLDPNFPWFSVGSFIWTGTGSPLFGVTAEGNIMNPAIPFSPFSPIFTTIGRANNSSVSVIYTYEAAPVVASVPISSALPLFLTGLIGLGLVVRRQNRTS